MKDWLFIISVLSVYLMRWFKHFEVSGSWSPQWLMQLDRLWGRGIPQTIPAHKTEIKSSEEKTIPFILMHITIANSYR